MRYIELLEYNKKYLLDTFSDKLENRWNQEQHNFKDEIGDSVDNLITWIEQYDPTQNKKYMKWIVQKYASGGIQRLEDIPARLQDALDTYNRLSRKKQLKPEHKDINRIKSLPDLEDVVDQYKKEDTSSKSEVSDQVEQGFYKSGDAELVFNDDKYKIVIPKSHEASCYFGKNTKWCTISKSSNYFNQYTKQGPLYIILDKKNNKRWQFHFQSGQYMDEKDRSISLDKFIRSHKLAVSQVIKHVGGLERAAIIDPKNWFKYIENPSERVQLEAVKRDGYAIQFIKNPSPEVQMAAVRQNGNAIEYIKNPSPEVQMAAVRQNGNAIEYIKNPSEQVQLAAKK